MFILFLSAIFAESIVDIVNNDPTSTWVAVDYPPSVITRARFIAMLGDHTEETTPLEEYVEPNALPENFDARTRWPGKLFAVRNQQSCGSCWAFTTSEAVGNRYSIKGCSKGMLSPQDLISCDKTDNACNGGSGATAANHVAKSGITTEACLPYVSGTGRVPACPAKCSNGTSIIRYKYNKSQSWTATTVQQELYSNGPVYFRFDVYDDFMSYKSGVYQHKTGASQGGHAVLLIGWGVQNGVKYWLLQNSWGPTWGEAGHFKILRGSNHCNCEKGFYAGSVSC